MKPFSYIQQMINESNSINDFKTEIRNLNSKYNIEQEIFGISENGKASTIQYGYLIVKEEYSNLEEALRNFDSRNDAIYIVDEETVILGEHIPYLDEAMKDKKVIDANTLREINL